MSNISVCFLLMMTILMGCPKQKQMRDDRSPVEWERQTALQELLGDDDEIFDEIPEDIEEEDDSELLDEESE